MTKQSQPVNEHTPLPRIVEMLRTPTGCVPPNKWEVEAADEIMRLRAALEEIAAERKHQIEDKGYDSEHDDAHKDGSIASAAAAYALVASYPDQLRDPRRPGALRWDGSHYSILGQLWKWEWEMFQPQDRRSDLIRAAALIVAEIERLDRALAAARQRGEG